MAMSIRFANLRAYRHEASRRHLLACAAGGAIALLAGCQTGATGKPVPPSLDDVKRWLNVLSPELPVFLNELLAAGSINRDLKAKADAYVGRAQTLVAQVNQLTPGADPNTLLNNISMLLASVLSMIPQAAPFIPLLLTLQAVITAFLASRPVTAPDGTPTAPPAPPAASRVDDMHSATQATGRQSFVPGRLDYAVTGLPTPTGWSG